MSSLLNFNSLIKLYKGKNLKEVQTIKYTEENKLNIVELLKTKFNLDTYLKPDGTLLVNKLPGGYTGRCSLFDYIVIREDGIDVYPPDMFKAIYKIC